MASSDSISSNHSLPTTCPTHVKSSSTVFTENMTFVASVPRMVRVTGSCHAFCDTDTTTSSTPAQATVNSAFLSAPVSFFSADTSISLALAVLTSSQDASFEIFTAAFSATPISS